MRSIACLTHARRPFACGRCAPASSWQWRRSLARAISRRGGIVPAFRWRITSCCCGRDGPAVLTSRLQRAWEFRGVQNRETTRLGSHPVGPGQSSNQETRIVAPSGSYAQGRAPLGPGRIGLRLFLGIVRLVRFRWLRLNLTGGLVLRQVELFFDLALAAGQFLVTLLALEKRANLGFQFLRPFGSVSDVVVELGGPLLEALDVGFERTDGALCRVRHPGSVTVPPAHNHFDVVVE